jgi:hypothetical protein
MLPHEYKRLRERLQARAKTASRRQDGTAVYLITLELRELEALQEHEVGAAQDATAWVLWSLLAMLPTAPAMSMREAMVLARRLVREHEALCKQHRLTITGLARSIRARGAS